MDNDETDDDFSDIPPLSKKKRKSIKSSEKSKNESNSSKNKERKKEIKKSPKRKKTKVIIENSMPKLVKYQEQSENTLENVIGSKNNGTVPTLEPQNICPSSRHGNQKNLVQDTEEIEVLEKDIPISVHKVSTVGKRRAAKDAINKLSCIDSDSDVCEIEKASFSDGAWSGNSSDEDSSIAKENRVLNPDNPRQSSRSRPKPRASATIPVSKVSKKSSVTKHNAVVPSLPGLPITNLPQKQSDGSLLIKKPSWMGVNVKSPSNSPGLRLGLSKNRTGKPLHLLKN